MSDIYQTVTVGEWKALKGDAHGLADGLPDHEKITVLQSDLSPAAKEAEETKSSKSKKTEKPSA